MSNKVAPFPRPYPLKTDKSTDGQIVCEVGANRFRHRLRHHGNESEIGASDPDFREKPWQRSPATPARSDEHDFVKIQDDQIRRRR